MDPRIKKLIGWIATHAERESFALSPDPDTTVSMTPLLDQIREGWELDPVEIDAVMERAQTPAKET